MSEKKIRKWETPLPLSSNLKTTEDPMEFSVESPTKKSKIIEDKFMWSTPMKGATPLKIGYKNEYISAEYWTNNKGDAKELQYLHYIHPTEWTYFNLKLDEVKVQSPISDCIRIKEAKDHPRVAIPQELYAKILKRCPNIGLPKKLGWHHIALYKANKPLPTASPPPKPFQGDKKNKIQCSKWVASHLCHCPKSDTKDWLMNINCVSPEHLIWEADWQNKLRDGCTGTIQCPCCTKQIYQCPHNPQCIYAHVGKNQFIHNLNKTSLS